MLVRQAVICAAAAVVVGVGGGVAVASARQHDDQPSSEPRTHQPGSASATPAPPRTGDSTTSPTPSPKTGPKTGPKPSLTTTSAPTPAPTAAPTSTPVDRLSEENVIRERLYYDVTGHSFSVVPELADPSERLGPCTGDTTFSDVVPRGSSQIETILAGSDVTRVTELIAQTPTATSARSAADRIVAMVVKCPGIQGGDFGYGDPVTVTSEASRKTVYFPGYDSDRRHGGYIVFTVGNRVGVVSVADQVGAKQVAHLATEATGIAAS